MLNCQYNSGVSFGLLSTSPIWEIIALNLVFVFIVVYIIIKSYHTNWGLVLVALGGIANLLERILIGHICDYISLLAFHFNIADVLIVGGTILISSQLIYEIIQYDKTKKRI